MDDSTSVSVNTFVFSRKFQTITDCIQKSTRISYRIQIQIRFSAVLSFKFLYFPLILEKFLALLVSTVSFLLCYSI